MDHVSGAAATAAAARSAVLSSSIQALLRPGTATFSSPTKSPLPRLLASPLKQRPLPSLPPEASSVSFSSPLRREARQPLEALRSPTANLPNSVLEGPEVLPLHGRQRVAGAGRQVDWLTSYCKQRKKESPAAGLQAKASRPKKKAVTKGKMNNL